MMKLLIASATLLAFTAPAIAQVAAQPPTEGASAMPSKPAHEDKFAAHDTDKNGSLSLAEVQKADKTVTQAGFDTYDADKSKGLSKAEFQKWAEAKHSAPASAPGE